MTVCGVEPTCTTAFPNSRCRPVWAAACEALHRARGASHGTDLQLLVKPHRLPTELTTPPTASATFFLGSMRWSGPELAELGADATLSGRLRRWRNWFAPVSDVHVQQSCLIVGFRSRWRVYPPPGEREAWPGDSETRFLAEDIA